MVAATAVENLVPPNLAIDDPQRPPCRATVVCPVSRLSTRPLEISVSEQAVARYRITSVMAGSIWWVYLAVMLLYVEYAVEGFIRIVSDLPRTPFYASWQLWVSVGAGLAWGVVGVLVTPRSYPRLKGGRVVMRDVAEQSAHDWVQRNPAGSIVIQSSTTGAATPEPR
ncbi:hypothetical protein ACNAW0_08260 [Micromonospora sp. SL1-18]|uniref:hypothetical protein n=1 Tax=Micromonospora sp. SL1-18 TaxID=3399128 RepID=UPI003A4D9C4B